VNVLDKKCILVNDQVSRTGRKEIDVSEFPRGAYLLQISARNGKINGEIFIDLTCEE